MDGITNKHHGEAANRKGQMGSTIHCATNPPNLLMRVALDDRVDLLTAVCLGEEGSSKTKDRGKKGTGSMAGQKVMSRRECFLGRVLAGKQIGISELKKKILLVFALCYVQGNRASCAFKSLLYPPTLCSFSMSSLKCGAQDSS